jgi:hypothetical protein
MPKIIVQTEPATETFPGAIAEGNWEFDGNKVTDSPRPLWLEPRK